MKVGMGDVEDGDVLSISVINDCTGNGDDAVVDSSLIVDMGDGDNVAVAVVQASAKKNVTYKIKPAWYKPLIPPFTARQLKNKLN